MRRMSCSNLLRLIALLAVFCCAGCYSVDVQSSLATYRATPSCCSSFDQLSYQPLSYPADVEFPINAQSPMFDFGPLGKSYVKAFALPAIDGDYRLVIHSYVAKDGLFDLAMFYPLVTFLDAEKRPIGTSTRQQLRSLPASWTKPPSVEFALLVPKQRQPRYLVVHTSRDLIEFGGQSLGGNLPRVAAGAAAPIFIPMDIPTGPISAPGSPVGNLEIELQAPRT